MLDFTVNPLLCKLTSESPSLLPDDQATSWSECQQVGPRIHEVGRLELDGRFTKVAHLVDRVYFILCLEVGLSFQQSMQQRLLVCPTLFTWHRLAASVYDTTFGHTT